MKISNPSPDSPPAPRTRRQTFGVLLLVLAILACVGSFGLWIFGPARYEAVARLAIDPPAGYVLSGEQSPSDRVSATEYIDLQCELLRSRSLLSSVVRTEKMAEFWPQQLDLVERLHRCVEADRVETAWGRLVDLRVTLEDPRKAAGVANHRSD